MKSLGLALFVTGFLTTGCSFASPDKRPVKTSGETVITTTIDGVAIRANIGTHEIQIGKESDGRPEVPKTSCTYSRYPCSVVDSVEVRVGEVKLFVPRSAFCDLADVNNGQVIRGETGFLLRLYGGDASESYVATIHFDKTRILSRTLASFQAPGEALQKTTYYESTLGD